MSPSARRTLLVPATSAIGVMLALAERRQQRTCGCSGCKVGLWLDDVNRWGRCLPFLRTDKQISAYARHGTRLLDVVEPMYLACADPFEVLAMRRGLDIIERVMQRLLNPALSIAIH